MVTNILTDEMIRAGGDLLQRIQAAGTNVTAALWMYLSEPEKWRLIIASPDVSKHGSRKLYEKIQSILADIPEDLPRLSLFDISVRYEDDSPIPAFRKAAKTYGDLSGKRYYKSMVNREYIDDAYIYEVN